MADEALNDGLGRLGLKYFLELLLWIKRHLETQPCKNLLLVRNLESDLQKLNKLTRPLVGYELHA